MSFKNAIKLLCSKFSLVWVVLLTVVITMVIVISVAIVPVKDMHGWLVANGLIDSVSAAFGEFLQTYNVGELISKLVAIVDSSGELFTENAIALWSFSLKIAFIVFILLKFLITSFEHATTRVIQGYMSDNAKMGFTGSYVSGFGYSMLYALVKTVIYFLIDVLICVLLYISCKPLMGTPALIPTVFLSELIILSSLKSSLFFAWSPYMVIEKRNVFSALVLSVKLAFENFGKIFTGYIVSWIIILTLSLLVAVFTFGAGLIIVIPTCMVFLSFLNMTYFYGKNHMRYYLDGKIFDIDSSVQNNL